MKAATFRTKAFCPDCRAIVYPEVPDYSKTVKMRTDLVDQAHGRPGTADGGSAAITLIVGRPNWHQPLTDDELGRATDEERQLLEQADAVVRRLASADR